MPDNETVTLKLPSGESVDFVVPGGMSDAEVKTFVLSKRPDLFQKTPNYNLSQQDIQDLQDIRIGLPRGDARISKIDQLLSSANQQSSGVNYGAAGGTNPATFGGALQQYHQTSQLAKADDFTKEVMMEMIRQSGRGQTPGANQITGISATPPSTGWRDSVARWAQNVSDDIKYGTDITGVGTVMKKMGAHGVYNGNPEAVGDFIASLPLGVMRATKGGAEVTQSGKTWQGTKDVVGGVGQALTIPSAFMGGPGVEAGASGAAAASGKLFGNIEWAGQLFNEVKAAAKTAEVPVSDEMYAAASRAMELSEAGAKGLPRVISKFMSRVTNPEKAPVTWDEARDFYSNVSRLSANEYQTMNPQMAGAVGKFAGAFDDSLRATAEAVGKGDEYAQAMQLYSTAKAWQRFGANVWGGFKQALPFAGGTAAGTYLARKAMDLLKENKGR